jgi:hypothetical protein
MKILVLGALFLLCGCVSHAPTIPTLTTAEGKACARSCQAIYAQCQGGCSQMVVAPIMMGQRSQCFSNCNQTLHDCYSTCE